MYVPWTDKGLMTFSHEQGCGLWYSPPRPQSATASNTIAIVQYLSSKIMLRLSEEFDHTHKIQLCTYSHSKLDG